MTSQITTPFKAFIGFGRRLGLNAYGVITSRMTSTDVPLGNKIADAVITISAEGATTANTRDVTVQLKDANGRNLDEVGYFEIVMYSSSAMTDFVAAGGSTGVQAGASGKLQAVIAKMLFRAISTTAGLWAGSYLDSGTAAGYLAVRLPNGRIIGGGDVTNT
jgi:hypothetical protein